VSKWKRQAIEGMAGVFSDKVKKAKNKASEIKEVYANIGQLAVENGTGAYAAPLGTRSPSFATRAKAVSLSTSLSLIRGSDDNCKPLR
tara:strand:+ start:155 stop:418 length:264 start_codon:yes stop_codon:yes gene_type:complete